MKAETIKAKNIMKDAGYTCVLCKNDKVYKSKECGIKPLLSFYESKKNFSRFCAADKIVGRAAAFIYAALGADEVWAEVMSKDAYELLLKNNIGAYYEVLTEKIINRSSTGLCPMEEACQGSENSEEAIAAIKEKIKLLMAGK